MKCPMLLVFFLLTTVAIAVAIHQNFDLILSSTPAQIADLFQPSTGLAAVSSDGQSAFLKQWEAQGVFGASREGQWSGKSGKHVPVISISSVGSGKVVVTVPHPDAAEHHTTAIWLRDAENGDLIGAAVTRGNVAEFPTGEYVKKGGGKRIRMKAYARCNLHGTWESEVAAASGS